MHDFERDRGRSQRQGGIMSSIELEAMVAGCLLNQLRRYTQSRTLEP